MIIPAHLVSCLCKNDFANFPLATSANHTETQTSVACRAPVAAASASIAPKSMAGGSVEIACRAQLAFDTGGPGTQTERSLIDTLRLSFMPPPPPPPSPRPWLHGETQGYR